MSEPIGRTLLEVTKVLWRQLGPLLAYEIVFFAISTVVFGPLLALAFSALLRLSGSTAVSNADIVAFAISIPGLVTGVVAGATVVGIAFAKQTGIMYLVGGRSERRSTIGAVLLTLRSLPRATRIGARMIAGHALLAAPFVFALVIIHATILGDKDINFYLATRPPSFSVAIGLAALVALGWSVAALLLYIRWIHAVPLALVGGDGADVLARSADAVRAKRRRAAGMVLSWAGAAALVGLVASGAMFLTASGVLRLVDAESGSLVAVIAVLWALELIVPVIVLTAWFDGHCVVKLRLYRASFPDADPIAGAMAAAAERDAAAHGLSWRVVLGLVVVAVLVTATYVTHRASTFLEAPITTTITAHRGSSLRAPENTLAAIEAAIEDGAHIAEIDVQELADGTIVLFHDSDLMRVAGDGRRIATVTYDEVRDVDAGTWFSPEFADQRIPTLEQAIDVARGRIRLNVELKFHGREQRFVESVVGILRDEGFLDDAVLTSLDHGGLAQVRDHEPSLPLGAIVTVVVGDLQSIDADFYSVESSLAKPALVRRLQGIGRGVHVWTINEPRRMGRYVDIGVDSIITDEPRLLADVIAVRAAMTPGERLLAAYHERRIR